MEINFTHFILIRLAFSQYLKLYVYIQYDIYTILCMYIFNVSETVLILDHVTNIVTAAQLDHRVTFSTQLDFTNVG